MRSPYNSTLLLLFGARFFPILFVLVLCDEVCACVNAISSASSHFSIPYLSFPLGCAFTKIQEPLLTNSFQQALSNGEPVTLEVGGAAGGKPSNQISKAFDTLAKELNPSTEGADGAGEGGAK